MLLLPLSVGAQEDEYTKRYEERIRQSELYGVYIPKDLAECFSELNKRISMDAKRKFLTLDEYEAAEKLHFSLGRWMWHNWGFHEGSRLSVYLSQMGLKSPDEMADLIIITYHRYLRKEPIDVPSALAYLEARREQEAED